jgi:hypothetical protein
LGRGPTSFCGAVSCLFPPSYAAGERTASHPPPRSRAPRSASCGRAWLTGGDPSDRCGCEHPCRGGYSCRGGGSCRALVLLSSGGNYYPAGLGRPYGLLLLCLVGGPAGQRSWMMFCQLVCAWQPRYSFGGPRRVYVRSSSTTSFGKSSSVSVSVSVSSTVCM